MRHRAPVLRTGVLLALPSLVVATAGVSGCANDAAAPSADQTAAAPSDDGRLTTADGRTITDWGNRSERLRAIRVLVKLQRDFRARRYASACRRVGSFMLRQFTPGSTEPDAPCAKKLAAYAKLRRRRDLTPQRWRLLWVRTYTTESGIWVEDRRGRRERIQITHAPDGRLRYDLGFYPARYLAGELVGIDAYLDRGA